MCGVVHSLSSTLFSVYTLHIVYDVDSVNAHTIVNDKTDHLEKNVYAFFKHHSLRCSFFFTLVGGFSYLLTTGLDIVHVYH